MFFFTIFCVFLAVMHYVLFHKKGKSFPLRAELTPSPNGVFYETISWHIGEGEQKTEILQPQ